MKRCKRVKNPCRICLKAVTNKSGIQCKGACKTWAHFTCLGYTCGKIQDIKAGVINITCPCPLCNYSESKQSLPCSKNVGCPEVSPTKCEITACPKNNPAPIPDYTRTGLGNTRSACGPLKDMPKPLSECKKAPKAANPNVPLKCLGHNATKPAEAENCNDPCNKSQTTQNLHNSKAKCVKTQHSDKNIPCRANKNENIDCGKEIIKKRNTGCNVVGLKVSTESAANRDCKRKGSDYRVDKIKSRVKNEVIKKDEECCCTTDCCSSSSEDEEGCCTCGKKSRSFSNVSDCLQGKRSKKPANSYECKSASDSALSLPCDSHKALLCTIHQLCSKVGHLSNQIKELMCKMVVQN